MASRFINLAGSTVPVNQLGMRGAGGTTTLSVSNNVLYINDAKVITYNIKCTNGVIMIIDKLLQIPPAGPG